MRAAGCPQAWGVASQHPALTPIWSPATLARCLVTPWATQPHTAQPGSSQRQDTSQHRVPEAPRIGRSCPEWKMPLGPHLMPTVTPQERGPPHRLPPGLMPWDSPLGSKAWPVRTVPERGAWARGAAAALSCLQSGGGGVGVGRRGAELRAASASSPQETESCQAPRGGS